MKTLLLITLTATLSFQVVAQTYNNTTVYTRKGTTVEGKILTSAEK